MDSVVCFWLLEVKFEQFYSLLLTSSLYVLRTKRVDIWLYIFGTFLSIVYIMAELQKQSCVRASEI